MELPEESAGPVAITGAARLSDILQLAKPRLSMLAAIVAASGYFMALDGRVPVVEFASVFLFTWLLSGGACALNMVMERETDALMERPKTDRFRRAE